MTEEIITPSQEDSEMLDWETIEWVPSVTTDDNWFTPPEKPEWDIWWMFEDIAWGEDESITHNWVITFTEDAMVNDQNYSSIENEEHAILITWWDVTISGATITKSWDAEWDRADFYWTNAAAIATDGTLELNNCSIITDWLHANAVFAYWDWEVIISDSTITTKNDNSWWIMVTWWGKLTANNVNITTNWNSSAAIRSDRWWGEINIEGWSYMTNWIWSPAIYSTADITVKNAQLTASQSEWAIVEWKNSITIEDSTLIDSNTTLNWQSETYKNIFLYQSMSGDADEWVASFSAKNSKIITNNGDTIYVTNTTAEISLENNEIINTSWDFLRIEWAAWWRDGNNWWNVTLNLINQKIEWDIIIDDISSLTMELTKWSNFTWAINSKNESQNISIKLDNNSTWTLNSDSYISEIVSNTTWYSNINLNWHILYVWENAISTTDRASQNETGITTVELTKDEWYSTIDIILWWIWIIAIVVAIRLCIKTYIQKK